MSSAIRRLKIFFIGAIAVAGVTASLMIRSQSQARLRESEAALCQQDNRLAELAAEQQRLSNLVAQASRVSAEDASAELLKLRSEVEALRKQTNELGRHRAEERQWRPSDSDSSTRSKTSSSVAAEVVSDSDSEEYRVQLYRMASAAPHSPPLTNDRTTGDARNLSSALRKYAREHQGEFPTNFDEAASYYYKDEPLPRTSEFELVYQGSLNELTNVPPQAVALIRERQAWPTPRGKWARVYVMVEGNVKVVESDDNFQSWEAAHVLPPLSARQ